MTPAQTLDTEFLSLWGPASMDNLLAGDSSLMDRDQDIPLLPLPFLPFFGAPGSARLLTRAPGHWVRTMEREGAVTAALQLQHDTGLIASNLQVLGQFVTSLNRIYLGGGGSQPVAGRKSLFYC